MDDVKMQIIFDNTSCVYYSGQTVSGSFHLEISKAIKLRNICMKFKGAANTSWTEKRREKDANGRHHIRTITITGYEEYFKLEYYLLGSASGDSMQLAPGKYMYPFSCSLPPNLPSSFESDFGHVRYTAKVIIDLPWKFDCEIIQPFTIVSSLDLNREPKAAEPFHVEMSKNFGCFCCASPPLTVNASIPVCGYVPGQDIPVKIQVENKSGKNVDHIKISLYKKIKYVANNPRNATKEQKILVTNVTKGPIRGYDSDEYVQHLKVPALPPSNLKNCGIIDLKYYLKINAHVSRILRRNMARKVEIYIGTIPLTMPVPLYNVPEIQAPLPPGPGFVIPSVPMEAPSAPSYSLMPPPSYEESMFGARPLKE